MGFQSARLDTCLEETPNASLKVAFPRTCLEQAPNTNPEEAQDASLKAFASRNLIASPNVSPRAAGPIACHEEAPSTSHKASPITCLKAGPRVSTKAFPRAARINRGDSNHRVRSGI